MANSAKIDFGDLEKKVMGILDTYSAEVTETMKEVIPEVAKETVKKLKAESPRGKGKSSGDYAKGWTMTTERDGSPYRLPCTEEKGPTIWPIFWNMAMRSRKAVVW